MTRINLLPDSVIERRAVARQRRARIWLGSALTVAAAVWLSVGLWHVGTLDARIAELEQENKPLRHEQETIAHLNAQLNSVGGELDAARELRPSLTPTAIMALLSQLAPQSIVLQNLSIELPTVSTYRDDHVPGDHSVQVQMDGLADADVSIAEFITILSDHPAIANVRLEDSRQAEHQQFASRFRISLEVPMYRSARAAADRSMP